MTWAGSRARLVALVFLLPLALVVVLFIVVPVAGTMVNSLSRDVVFLEREFVGIGHFAAMWADPGFVQALRFTLLFTAVSVGLELLLGLGFALLLDLPMRGRNLIRAAVLIPWAVPTAVSSRAWELVYNYAYGLANAVLGGLGLTDEPVNWLGSSSGAFAALVLADVWKTTPFVAIIVLAGLQTIPAQLHRQAEVDGAHFGQRFWWITLPLLRPVLIIALLFRVIDALRVFDVVYVVTRGGPGGATTSLSVYAYNYFAMGDFGYGAAVSVVLFVVALVLAVVTLRLGRFAQEVSA